MADKRKLYPRVRRTSNWEGPKFPINEQVIVQEKLDGSNITIQLTDKGTALPAIEIFSRTTKIDQDQPKNWKPLVDWVQKHFTKEMLQYAASQLKYSGSNDLRLHGEWLMMAKLPYNKTHKNTFWLFDVWTDGDFFGWDAVQQFAKHFKLNVVPAIETSTLGGVIMGLPNLVINQKSLVPASDSPREGIVVKLLDGSMRMKFVSPKFKEGMGRPRDKSVPLFQINSQLVTDNMIQKYIHKLKEEGTLPLYVDYNDGPTIGTIFKHSKKLLDDFMEEEFANFLKLVTNLVKKESGKSLNNYVKKQQLLQMGSKEQEL